MSDKLNLAKLTKQVDSDTNAEKELLKEQLSLLFKKSQETSSVDELCRLTEKMIELYKVLYSIMFN